MQKTRIPTLLGLVLVLGTLFLFSLVFERVTPLISKASVSTSPANVVTSNVTDTTFSVSWTTSGPATGTLAIEDSGGTKFTAFDDRDQQVSTTNTKPLMGKYMTHMVTVRSAKPNTPYHTRIVSNGKLFGDGPKTFDVTTGPTLPSNGTAQEPAFGTVTTPTDLPADGALVYLALEGSQTLTTFVKSSGSWVIPLHLIRTENYQSYIAAGDRIAESIIVRASSGDATAVTDTINDNPVPAMVIGKSYDFRKIQANAEQPRQLADATTDVLGSNTQTQKPNGVIALVQPKDGAALSTTLPLFTGTGVPDHTVQLIIGITHPSTGIATVGADGIWRFTPTAQLGQGKQSVTITTTDIQGKSTAITHTFEILKSGTQVLGDATPSATIAPTLMPTIEITPTVEATLAGEPIPKTGSPLPLMLLLLAGTGLITAGYIARYR